MGLQLRLSEGRLGVLVQPQVREKQMFKSQKTVDKEGII